MAPAGLRSAGRSRGSPRRAARPPAGRVPLTRSTQRGQRPLRAGALALLGSPRGRPFAHAGGRPQRSSRHEAAEVRTNSPLRAGTLALLGSPRGRPFAHAGGRPQRSSRHEAAEVRTNSPLRAGTLALPWSPRGRPFAHAGGRPQRSSRHEAAEVRTNSPLRAGTPALPWSPRGRPWHTRADARNADQNRTPEGVPLPCRRAMEASEDMDVGAQRTCSERRPGGP
jgi:hypothetical protein